MKGGIEMTNPKESLQNEADAMKKIAAEFERLSPAGKQRVVNWLSSVIEKEIPSAVGGGEPLIPHRKGQGDRQAIKKMWEEKQPKNNYQKLTVLGYFLEFVTGKEEFTLADLCSLWRDNISAGLPGGQVLTNAKNACLTKYQYFIRGSKQGLNRVGPRGQELVESLPNPPKKLLRKVKTKRGKKRIKTRAQK